VAGGARVILGGKRPSADSAFFEPTILTNVEKGTPSYDEELFGPVAAVMTVPGEETAIAVANTPNTASAARSTRAISSAGGASRIKLTPAWSTSTTRTGIYEDMPFDGIKKSGYGRETGALGIQEFVNKKLFREPEIVEKNF
jgi:succinate-semialdehyde dehydrogenase / glutarate-semialdehyde dehydrogenase